MNTMNSISDYKQDPTISLAQYQKLQEEFAEKEKKFEERIWLDTTVGQFDNLLRLNYNKSTAEFAKVVLNHAAELTKAYAGVFYVQDLENQLINAMAGYACSLRKLAQREYEIGEGIVGQAAETKKIMFFKDLPPKNIEIKSSTLNIAAASILVLPLVFNDRAFGVIELIYLDNLDEKYLNLLDVVSRNVAAMLESITNNELTKHLLQQSQEQAEALRAQEEEMRQNMEEMKATQEAVANKQKELEYNQKRTRAIFENSIDAIVVCDKNGRVNSLNQAARELFKVNIEGNQASLEQAPITLQHFIKKFNPEKPSSFLNRKRRTKAIDLNGDKISVEAYIYLENLEGENIYLAYIRDITKEMEKEQQIAENLMLLDELKAKERGDNAWNRPDEI